MARLEEGQVAVITGAAAGMGFALAEAVLRKGMRVVITDRHSFAQPFPTLLTQLTSSPNAPALYPVGKRLK
ncbi:hypothetical protein LMG31506_01796 [Cupriavidus yeoncheonensis]|uniref:SDR family NAD(P)-dependent oxidoreductase n=1 Tax=Cupriavidus yeoncheonensis TaxID=1462994 RepID=A0A916IR44_9BURK|nr:SDR family NAD(P)-dependent oxidoreductase [Cupriavidus yeoncheonensis]CAG2137172.1 hypothetical protein LMG31506_01796 [Cupriavidus yeoncheonensis]